MKTDKKIYLIDIGRLTGLTIALVVVGHLVTGQDINTPGLEWYKFLKRYLYSFHMPLFMFLSGFLFFYTLPKISNKQDYVRFINKKIKRLLPSFIFFSVLIFVIKISISKLVVVDNTVNNYSDYFKVFYDPVYSFAGFLWYVYVLFQYYLIFPILLRFVRPVIIVVVSLGLYFIEATHLFAIDFFLKFLVFFSLGVLSAQYYPRYKKILMDYKWLFIVVFLCASVVFYFITIPKLIMGVFSIFGLHSLILVLSPSKYKVLSTLGLYSFSIYLMNNLVTGFVKAIGFRFFEISYSNFLVIALLMVFLGITIPIVIKKYIINKIPKVGKYIG